MHTPHLVIDATWYRRPPAAKERITAGGVVLRREGRCVYLALAREGDFPPFVLPKGGVEPDEPIETAARREILEEVGLSDLQLIGPLAVLERLSYDKQYWVRTHYFLYTTTQKDGTPTDTQRHAAVWWFSLNELPVMLWPEQRRLIDTHRATFETVCSPPPGTEHPRTSRRLRSEVARGGGMRHGRGGSNGLPPSDDLQCLRNCCGLDRSDEPPYNRASLS